MRQLLLTLKAANTSSGQPGISHCWTVRWVCDLARLMNVQFKHQKHPLLTSWILKWISKCSFSSNIFKLPIISRAVLQQWGLSLEVGMGMLRNGETGKTTPCYVVIAVPWLHDWVIRVTRWLQSTDGWPKSFTNTGYGPRVTCRL
jgi:hypothetical protein